jgi:diacylglycerol kinase (ATP)
MEKARNSFLGSVLSSFRPAIRGLRFFLQSPSNAWIHLIAAILATGLAYVLRISRGEWLALILAIGGVFVSEMLNTAIELLTDIVSPEFDERAGKLKDIAAGAVLLASLAALVAGAIIFLPKLIG